MEPRNSVVNFRIQGEPFLGENKYKGASQWYCLNTLPIKYETYSGSTRPATVSYVESPSCVWIQVNNNCHKAETQLVELNEFYSQETSLQLGFEPPFKVGHYCAALSSMFSNWYRGRVNEYNPVTNMATILFIDYGFYEECPLEFIRPLARVFAIDQAYAMKVHLKLETKSNVEDEAVVNAILDFCERKRVVVSLTYKNELMYANIEGRLRDDLAMRGLVAKK